MKQCVLCGEMLPEAAYNLDKTRQDGLQRECKACNKARGRKWYAENRRRKIAYTEAYKAEHGASPYKPRHKPREKTEIELAAERLGLSLEPEPAPESGEQVQGRVIQLPLADWEYLAEQPEGISAYLRALLQRDRRRAKRR